ncbi:DUF2225 domain-containing protein [Alkalihalobacterium elongatum]|uniref:DUF2225 domain-containing protein n=1 Tax=Alkalihalobacterium elongatum TaxID=2675466 RepID=UPI001C1F4AB9|nr:DUF2225 domain-containing protein [Alkalihalobacterium elongatum]
MGIEVVPLYDKSCTCSLCDYSFTTKKLRSRFGTARQIESDFYTQYLYEEKDGGLNPLLYYVNVCPSCGYGFSDEASCYFPPGSKDRILQAITSKWKGHTYFGDERTLKIAIDAYKLAIYSGSLKKERAIVLAGLAVRLSWLHRTGGNELEEQRFKGIALQNFEKAYYEADYKNSGMSVVRLVYLIGELHRSFQNYAKASQYFSKIIYIKEPSKDKPFIEMARDRWYDMAQENRSRQKELKSLNL